MTHSYLLATGSSWGVALGMNYIVTPGTMLHRLVPFFAGAGPQLFNVGFVRKKEIVEGKKCNVKCVFVVVKMKKKRYPPLPAPCYGELYYGQR